MLCGNRFEFSVPVTSIDSGADFVNSLSTSTNDDPICAKILNAALYLQNPANQRYTFIKM